MMQAALVTHTHTQTHTKCSLVEMNTYDNFHIRHSMSNQHSLETKFSWQSLTLI